MPPPIPSDRRQLAAPRLVGAVTAVVAATPLVLASGLSPAAEGHGTHTQLGLPDCTWAVSFGKPCASCGMTTSWTWMAEGGFQQAFLTQPFGALLAVVAAAVAFAGIHTALTGVRITPLFGWLLKAKAITLVVSALLAAWVYKIVTW